MTTILVVDDNTLDQQIAGACVQEAGCEAIYAAHGLEALEVVKRDKPDIVLTDLQMPEMDGLELVGKLTKDNPQMPVILMTAFGSEQIAVEALQAGAASYVPKKNLRRDLRHALRGVLSAVATIEQRDTVRNLLEEMHSQFVVGYEPNAPRALIMYLREELDRLNFGDTSTLLRLSTALMEALANAIDHGNLELNSELRESGGQAYSELGRQRVKQPPYSDRRVHVTAILKPSEAKFVILDEGPGFDTSSLPDPTDPENLLKPSGRGILLMRTFLNEVSFNEKGNEVTLLKNRV